MPHALVSVLMPVRDGERWLEVALTSVLNQTLRQLELVVVDDASSDGTPEILRRYADGDSRVRVVRRQVPGGVATALNQAADHAGSAILARLDADDTAAPDRLARQLAAFEDRPDLGLLGTGTRYIDADGETFLVERPPSGENVRERLLEGNPFVHSSVAVRRDVFRRVGGYRPHCEPAEDYDLWLRISEVAEVDNLVEPLTGYRIHGDQVSLSRLEDQAVAAAAAAWAATERRAGRSDPLAAAGATDVAALARRGLPADALRERTLNAYQWHAAMLGLAGADRATQACWDAAEAQAAAAGRALLAQTRLARRRAAREAGDARAATWHGMRALLAAPAQLSRAALSKGVRRTFRA